MFFWFILQNSLADIQNWAETPFDARISEGAGQQPMMKSLHYFELRFLESLSSMIVVKGPQTCDVYISPVRFKLADFLYAVFYLFVHSIATLQ